MSETEEQNNTEVLRSNIETDEIEISEEDLRDFQRFQAQKEAKKLRAQKKRELQKQDNQINEVNRLKQIFLKQEKKLKSI